MISHEFFSKWELHYVKAEERGSLLGLVEYGVELAHSGGPGENLDLPAIFDLRSVELTNDSTQDIKRAISLRKGLKLRAGGNPCAYVVGSLGSFGIMRMYSIYAELEGLRAEDKTFVTQDYLEAVDWITQRLNVSAVEKQRAEEVLVARGNLKIANVV